MKIEARTVRWHGPQLAKGWLDGVVVGADGLALAPGRDTGTWTAPLFCPGMSFDRVVPFWNARTGAGDWVAVEIRAARGGKPLSDWLRAATWSKGARGLRDTGAKPARIDQDTLLLDEGADTVELRLRLERAVPAKAKGKKKAARGAGGAGPAVSRAGITVFLGRRDPPGDARSDAERAPSLVGPFHSQKTQDPEIAMRICGPTSLTMALGACGIRRTPVEVARAAEDPGAAIAFGNWAYLAATAAEHGLGAEVVSMRDMDELARTLGAGRLAILSVSFEDGALTGSPVKSTDGHLILARGFDEHGNVVVDDPAGRTEAEGRLSYRRDELARAWRRGIAIVLEPPVGV